jgi:uncharacterized protein with PIN domain
MNQLFVSLYVDEDVHGLIARLVRARQFEVVTTQQAGMLEASDDEQLAYAASRGHALLTHNRVDFERLATAYVERGLHHAGIILAVRRPPHDVARRLLALLDTVTADELWDAVRYI